MAVCALSGFLNCLQTNKKAANSFSFIQKQISVYPTFGQINRLLDEKTFLMASNLC
jgi:hypothetical protein